MAFPDDEGEYAYVWGERQLHTTFIWDFHFIPFRLI